MQEANGIGYIIGIVVVMVIVLMATYFGSKFVASKFKRYSSSKYMKILDQLYITKDKAIVMMKIGEKTVVLGVANQSINMISEIDKDDVSVLEEETKPIMDIGKRFTDYFREKWIMRKIKRKRKADLVNQTDDTFKEIFNSIDKQKHKFDKYYAKDENENETV